MNKYTRSSNLSSAEALSAFDAPRHRADVDAMPSDLDPDRHPIIAEHFFGWRRHGDVTAGIIRELRRRRNEAGADRLPPTPLHAVNHDDLPPGPEAA